ncbi:MAG: PIN domain-containing protein [Candidatus Hydrogenedentes bacterium]|nr:PIN domain-containing protein [Candidatus Hydrogenedentota bacterium]MDK1020546.1 PIN domain-containing protein [Candidatus Hydrogenedentota bacterium]
MADVVLLDTTVVSLLHPRKKNSRERSFYEPHMKGKNLAMSFQSVAELHEWAENNNWAEPKRQELDAFIRRFLVIPYDYELAKGWAVVMSASRREGRRFTAGDCWIAATAVHRELPLLTHDSDFVGRAIPGLNVISGLEQSKAGSE